MLKTDKTHLLANLWDQKKADTLSPEEQLLYRSNLLGSDQRITNYGGGNTSSKIMQADPLSGEQVEVLWVKGSGGDVGTMKLDGFSTLYLNKLVALKNLYRGIAHEDEMVGYLPHCTFNLNPRAASIDTPLHAYLPAKFVDHMHPDAIIAIAASADSKALTQRVFGDRIGWLPWRRPGFELGLMLEKFALENPDAEGVVLESHGLFTWGDTPKACYENTVDTINTAIDWFALEVGDKPAFGGTATEILDAGKRKAMAATLMPRIRGMIGKDSHKVGHFDDSEAVLEFVSAKDMSALAALGTSCPDHFLRTKICPLVIDFDAEDDAALEAALVGYRKMYAAYYEACKHDNSPAMRDPNPVVYLIPGVGMITFAANKATARIAGEFYTNAINVMRGASMVSTYVGLPQQEAFDIEYWLLEEAKLQRLPKPKALAGRVALVTGAAGGIGRAVAERLLGDGACVLLTDIDNSAVGQVTDELARSFGADQVRAVQMDVTSEASVRAATCSAALEFGGLDILVSNAGIVTGAPLDETDLATWQLNMDVLATGYFLVAREAFKVMKQQGTGGSVVFIASKNGLAASPNASAYCTAKAAEIHLARCIALEGAPHGIRANVVNPDGVLKGSRLWDETRRAERAKSYGVAPEELDDFYAQRSLLKRPVYPEDIAEAVAFLSSELAAKSTGNIINVDAGNAQSFTR